MSVYIFEHPGCQGHEMGAQHPERPERVASIHQALKQSAFTHDLIWKEAQKAGLEHIYRAHDRAHVDALFHQAPTTGYRSLDPDTIMNPHTLEAALRACGSVIEAVDCVMDTSIKKAFCNVRPPGHHAEHAKAMGFCFFNSIAIAALYALNVRGLKKLAILDIDVHHGNGTQDILFYNPDVLFCSIFEHPFYPGTHLDTNAHVLHAPCPPGTSGSFWRQQISAWFDEIEAFKPQCIFVSAGFDGHQDDPLAHLNLQASDYAWAGEKLSLLANQHARGRLIASLEGGYHLDALKQSVASFIEKLNEN